MSAYDGTFPELIGIPSIPERVWRTLHGRHDRQRQRAILSYPWAGRVLEVGSGRGYVSCLIARTYATICLVGLEPESKYLAQSRELATKNGVDTFVPIAGRGERLPFRDKSFDWVLVSEVLEHIEHPLAVLREVARVLKPDSNAVLSIPSHGAMPPGTVAGHVQDFTIEAFRALIHEAGMTVADHQTVAVFEFYRVQPQPLPWEAEI